MPFALGGKHSQQKAAFDLHGLKAEYEREVGHMLGGVAKASAAISLKELADFFKTGDPAHLLKVFEAKLAVEWGVRLGPLENVSGALVISPLPVEISFELKLGELPYIPPKLHAKVEWKAEIQFAFGPGPAAWEKLIQTVGEPVWDVVISLIEAGVFEGIVLALAVSIPVITLVSVDAAEKEGEKFALSYEYAMAYAAKVFGGRLPPTTDSANPKSVEKYRARGEKDAIHDARESAKQQLHMGKMTDKAALKFYQGAYKNKPKRNDHDARIALFDEVLARSKAKMGVSWSPHMNPPTWL